MQVGSNSVADDAEETPGPLQSPCDLPSLKQGEKSQDIRMDRMEKR